MLKSVIRFCVKEPWLAVLLAVGVSAYGWYSYRSVPIDAIPDICENQVIVLTPSPGRSPKDIEDQVTYPLSVSLLSVPGAESVRGKSLFGTSFVQVTFTDDVDFYWARSRVSEQLSTAASKLPEGVTPELGPDATGLGQVSLRQRRYRQSRYRDGKTIRRIHRRSRGGRQVRDHH